MWTDGRGRTEGPTWWDQPAAGAAPALCGKSRRLRRRLCLLWWRGRRSCRFAGTRLPFSSVGDPSRPRWQLVRQETRVEFKRNSVMSGVCSHKNSVMLHDFLSWLCVPSVQMNNSIRSVSSCMSTYESDICSTTSLSELVACCEDNLVSDYFRSVFHFPRER